MEYRFSLTPRLAALGIFACAALLALLFILGFVLGLRMGTPAPAPVAQPMQPAALAVPARAP